MALTHEKAKAARAKRNRYAITDDGAGSVRGLELVVHPTGAKRWRLRYRIDGRRRSLSLGGFPEVTLRDARRLAASTLSRVASGDDPATERDRKRSAWTVRALSERAISEHWRRHSKARTQKSVEALVRIYIAPKLGSRLAEDVTPSDVSSWHAAISRKHPGAANRALAALSKMFSLAVLWGAVRSNPCAGVRRNRESRSERFLDGAEYERLAGALEAAEGRQGFELPVAAIRLLMLTGLRHSDVLALTWDRVDAANRELVFRHDDSKSGEGRLALSPAAWAVLEAIPKRSFWVFPSSNKPGVRIYSLSPWWHEIRRDADLDGVRLHDLRHSFASMGIRSGVSLAEMKDLLRHKRIETTMRYVHLTKDAERAAAERVGEGILRALRSSD